MSASLEERIRQLERRAAQQNANVIAPREVWTVYCRPKPSTSWPSTSSTRFFWGVLQELDYDPTAGTPSLTTTDLAKTTDATKPGWIRFYSPFYVFEGMTLEVRQSRDYPNNWFVSRMPGNLYAWIPTAGIAARVDLNLNSTVCDIYYDNTAGTELASLQNASAAQVSGPIFNPYPEDADGCRFAPIYPAYGGNWHLMGWGCSAETTGSPCAAPT